MVDSRDTIAIAILYGRITASNFSTGTTILALARYFGPSETVDGGELDFSAGFASSVRTRPAQAGTPSAAAVRFAAASAASTAR